MAKRRKEGCARQTVLLSGERIVIGVDVHKRSFSVALWSEERGIIADWTQPSDAPSLIKKLASFKGSIKKLVYEAGPTGYGLARVLIAEGFSVEVIAPSKTLVSACSDNKSDRLDCRKLATFAGKGLLQAVRIPTEAEEADRQIVRLREQLGKKRRTLRQQIKSFLLQHSLAEPQGLGCWSAAAVQELKEIRLPEYLRLTLDTLLEDHEHFGQQMAKLNKTLKTLSESQRHKSSMEILRSVPGVGLITAVVFKMELIEPERFKNERELARMIGLAPRVMEEAGLMKSGNRRVRTALIEAAWQWVRRDEKAKKKFKQLLINTGEPNKAIAAMARRLGVLLWRLLRNGELYQSAEAA